MVQWHVLGVKFVFISFLSGNATVMTRMTGNYKVCTTYVETSQN